MRSLAIMLSFLPVSGRGTSRRLVEGLIRTPCQPLHHALARAVPLPVPGRNFGRQFLQGLYKLRPQLRERALDAAGAADQDVVGAGDSGLRKDRLGELAEAALHPVA